MNYICIAAIEFAEKKGFSTIKKISVNNDKPFEYKILNVIKFYLVLQDEFFF